MRKATFFASLALALLVVSPVSAAKPVKSFLTVDTPVVHVGDTLTITTSNDGVATCYGALDGTVLWANPFVGTSETYSAVVGYSQAWAANPVPLDGYCELYQVRGGRVRVVASDTFSLLP